MVRAGLYWGLWLLTWPCTSLLYGNAVLDRREEQRKRILFSKHGLGMTSLEQPKTQPLQVQELQTYKVP